MPGALLRRPVPETELARKDSGKAISCRMPAVGRTGFEGQIRACNIPGAVQRAETGWLRRDRLVRDNLRDNISTAHNRTPSTRARDGVFARILGCRCSVPDEHEAAAQLDRQADGAKYECPARTRGSKGG